MKYESAIYLAVFFGLATARPTVLKREVPQENSHKKFLIGTGTALNLDNPDAIVDPVFGLLGNAAASEGAGAIANPDCLHKATADRAFTNAKAAADVKGMSDSLIYAALERNTGSVGLASVICDEVAVNAEIEAITQHQDPASENAAAINKAIVLELAKQLNAIGADPLLALQSGTFAPGQIGDPTGAGLTCDDDDCIFEDNRLVEDASAEEIAAAVGGGGAAGGATGNETVAAPPAAPPAGNDTGAACPEVTTVTVDAPAATAAPTATGGAADAIATDAPTGTNVQTFTGTLGGPPPAVESGAGDRPFTVNGNTFVNIGAALQRSCAIQNNACANAINSGAADGSVSDCAAQEAQCKAAGGA